ncbi:MAG: hypothetical protein QM676_03850 [Novosphingobium sp.]
MDDQTPARYGLCEVDRLIVDNNRTLAEAFTVCRVQIESRELFDLRANDVYPTRCDLPLAFDRMPPTGRIANYPPHSARATPNGTIT